MSENDVTNIPALSPTEQRIYSKLYPKRVVTTDDVKEIEEDNPAKYITNLGKKGYFKKIKKGLYAIAPPDMIDQEELRPDKFLVASKTKDRYYISHHSALEIHGLAQTVHNRVYITAETPGRSFSYDEIQYKIITTKHFFGFKSIDHLNSSIVVSDREKTVLDCIRYPKYAGGMEEIIKSLEGLPSMDWNTLLKYLQRIDEKSLYQKTGFIMEKVGPEDFKKISDRLLSRVENRTYYLDKSKDSYYVKKWNVMVPKRFKEWVRSA